MRTISQFQRFPNAVLLNSSITVPIANHDNNQHAAGENIRLANLRCGIFGLGYGLERLADVAWLERTEVWYCGDIDTHGFAILNRLRRYLPHARSFLMDRATLDMHRSLCVQEPAAQRFTGLLQHLNEPEQTLYQALRDDTLGPRLRLEQERISYAWLERFLGALVAGS